MSKSCKMFCPINIDRKDHRNGIHRPKKMRKQSMKGVSFFPTI